MRKTRSVCPVCLAPLDARLVERDNIVYMEKACPVHGAFSVPVWHNRLDMALWRKSVPPLLPDEGLHCPTQCGVCGEHVSGTCCALLEVTPRCNLRCAFCFANGGESGGEPSLAALQADALQLLRKGDRPLIQLSGGEPTLRDDLPELIAFLKENGCPYVQLNTNGLRLGAEPAYTRALAEAGLSFVFLQFDGITEDVYETLRGRPLLQEKLAVIDACAACGLGVTLVPTVVRGVNESQLGDIVRLGVSLSPTVRGVHFQPVSYFGRFPADTADRYTLDILLSDLCRQLGMETDRFSPSRCDHPMCGFHGSFVVQPDGGLLPLGSFAAQEARKTTAVQNREYVARRWLRAAEAPCCRHGADSTKSPGASVRTSVSGARVVRRTAPAKEARLADTPVSMDAFLARAKEYAFTLTAMAFQDAMNLDIERLRHCSLHVWHEGKLVPFCARYLTPIRP